MKKKLRILFTFLVCILLAGCSEKDVAQKEIEVYGYVPPEQTDVLVENNDLEFHFNTDTTQFYVVKKSTGMTWYSNPKDADKDTLADMSSKNALQSPISIKYSTSAGVTTALDSYSYSVVKGIYKYELLENGIKVMYSLGDIERTYLMPIAVPESRMKEFYDKLAKSDQRQIDEYYRRYDINKLRSTDDKAALLKQYPDLKKERMYILRDSVAPYLKVKIESIFQTAGYTQGDYDKDIARYATVSKKDTSVFQVSVIYELEEDNLVVTVPFDEIKYVSETPITEIKVLPFFGAGGREEDGYVMVPDGSGGIIHFNNGKNTQNPYTNTVYGWDYGISRNALIDENRAVFPVFGIGKSGSSLLCILEEGAPYATIEADVSGRLHNYNYAAATYTLIHGEVMDISAKSDKTVMVYEDTLPKEVIKQRYSFLDSDNYVDMATDYRNYLLTKYPDLGEKAKEKSTKEGEVPVALEIIGATDRVKQQFGIPRTVSEPLTTYKEAAAMVEKLSSAGFTNLNINLNGWFNQGVVHTVPDHVNLISELGGKKEFTNMVKKIEAAGANLYLQGTFGFIYKNKLLDGFNTNRDSAKFVSRELVKLYPFSFLWYGEREDADLMYYLAKPSYSMKLIEKFNSNIQKLGVKNIAFNDLGRYLSADYNPKNTISRQEALELQTAKLKELSDGGANLMVYAGNSYSLSYADFILDMKLDSKGFHIIDEEIPFYQIALHGIVPYAGKAINQAEDYNKNLLKTLETGAGLYFLFMDEPTATLQESNYTEYYAADFSKWFDSSKNLYSELKDKLSNTYNQYITGHQKLTEGVFETTYEDGTKVIVNYNQADYSYNGKTVSKQGYLIEASKEDKGGNVKGGNGGADE